MSCICPIIESIFGYWIEFHFEIIESNNEINNAITNFKFYSR